MPFSPKPHSIPFKPDSVAIMGISGAFAHVASNALFRDYRLDSCATFGDAFKRVATGHADVAIIPVANTEASNVPYVHKLLRDSGLFVIGEYHLPVEHQLVTVPGASLKDIKTVHSHPHALAQCQKFFAGHPRLEKKQSADTATAAKMVADKGDPSQAAISSSLAAKTYGLETKISGIQDRNNNLTRFLAVAGGLARYGYKADGTDKRHFITTLMLKPHRTLDYPLLEIDTILKRNKLVHPVLVEYTGQYFRNEGYYMEVVGHPKDKPVANAIEQLRRITSEIKMIGAYATHHFRRFPERQRSAELG